MSSEEQDGRPVNDMLREHTALRERITEIENRMFKIETRYFEITGANPITRTVEYYISNKLEKKAVPDGRPYAFASDHPRIARMDP